MPPKSPGCGRSRTTIAWSAPTMLSSRATCGCGFSSTSEPPSSHSSGPRDGQHPHRRQIGRTQPRHINRQLRGTSPRLSHHQLTRLGDHQFTQPVRPRLTRQDQYRPRPPGDGRVLSGPSSRVHEPCSSTEVVALRSQTGLTGSGSHRSSYGGFGGRTPTFPPACSPPAPQKFSLPSRCMAVDEGRWRS
jgi:hypothetical protein